MKIVLCRAFEVKWRCGLYDNGERLGRGEVVGMERVDQGEEEVAILLWW